MFLSSHSIWTIIWRKNVHDLCNGEHPCVLCDPIKFTHHAKHVGNHSYKSFHPFLPPFFCCNQKGLVNGHLQARNFTLFIHVLLRLGDMWYSSSSILMNMHSYEKCLYIKKF